MASTGGVAQSWLDLQGLKSLARPATDAAHAAAARQAGGGAGAGPQGLRAVAQQFESVFLGMMLESMRDAKLAESPYEGEETRFYQDLFDKQVAVQLSQGRGLGIADLLVRQLGGEGGPAAAGAGVALPPATVDGPAARGAAALAAVRAGGALAATVAGGGPELPFVAGTFDPASFGAVGVPALDAAATGTPPARSGAFADSPADFVRRVLPHARAAGEALGVDPRAIVAHAALETGWGRSVPAAADGRGWNLFGIKAGAGWGGARVVRDTLEFEGGAMTRRSEAFRAYDSLAGGFDDYVRLLGTSPRYADAVATGRDGAAFARGLQAGGYATDPEYARKLESILHGDTLREALATLQDPAAGPM